MTAKVFEEEPEHRPPSVRTRVSPRVEPEEDDDSPVDLQALAAPGPVVLALELEPDEEEETRVEAPRRPPSSSFRTPILAELLARAAEEEMEPVRALPSPPPERVEPAGTLSRALERARLPAPNLAWTAAFAGLVWSFGKGPEAAGMMGGFCLALTLLGVNWKKLVGAASVALLAAAGTELFMRWDRFAAFFSAFF